MQFMKWVLLHHYLLMYIRCHLSLAQKNNLNENKTKEKLCLKVFFLPYNKASGQYFSTTNEWEKLLMLVILARKVLVIPPISQCTAVRQKYFWNHIKTMVSHGYYKTFSNVHIWKVWRISLNCMSKQDRRFSDPKAHNGYKIIGQKIIRQKIRQKNSSK